ncbi:MAG: RHS repeat-associated core domain-containing protein, partial [Vulcanimicrobiota bacterium]
ERYPPGILLLVDLVALRRSRYVGAPPLNAGHSNPAQARLGRFVRSDPAGVAGGPNRFVYGGNSPNNFVDPHGLWDAYDDELYLNKSRSVGDQMFVRELKRRILANIRSSQDCLDAIGTFVGTCWEPLSRPMPGLPFDKWIEDQDIRIRIDRSTNLANASYYWIPQQEGDVVTLPGRHTLQIEGGLLSEPEAVLDEFVFHELLHTIHKTHVNGDGGGPGDLVSDVMFSIVVDRCGYKSRRTNDNRSGLSVFNKLESGFGFSQISELQVLSDEQRRYFDAVIGIYYPGASGR